MSESKAVHDNLGSVMDVAGWVKSLGGNVFDPMRTFDCAFEFKQAGEWFHVNVGDTVHHEGEGRFRVEKAVWL